MSLQVPDVSAEPLRRLSANDLGIGGDLAREQHGSNRPDDPLLAADDPILLQTLDLLDQFGGIIYTGPPGTSKSWYASKVAHWLTDGDTTRTRFVQFHPSYQYEDFVQGFVPKQDGTGFTLEPKHFMKLCREAAADPDRRRVLVIDELSRGDPGRIFGEVLTYVESSKRGLPVDLASGDQLVVPPNLVILATMNPLDRGVDEVDAAFERRFAKIAMEPNPSLLAQRLEENELPEVQRRRLLGFFRDVNKRAEVNPLGKVGHTFFMDVSDAPSLEAIWNHQLRFLFERAYRLDPDSLQQITGGFEQIWPPDEQTDAPPGEETPAPADGADTGEPSPA